MIDTSQRIQTIAKSDLKSHTVKQMRKDELEYLVEESKVN